MASQIIERKALYGASGSGSLIAINSSTEMSPTEIHSSGSDATKQHAVFLELHNNSADRVIVHMFWMPNGASYGLSPRLTYNIGPYSSVIASDGYSLGRDSPLGGKIAIAAYLNDSGDTGKVVARGYYDVINQPI